MDPPERRQERKGKGHELKVDNLADGEVVGYPLQRLVGRFVGAPDLEGFVEVRVDPPTHAAPAASNDGKDNEKTKKEEEEGSRRWVVAGGRFKALALLRRGDNVVSLRYVPRDGEHVEDDVASSVRLRVHYEPLLIDNRFAPQSQAIVTPAQLGRASSDADDGEREGKEASRHFVRLIYLVACDDVVGAGDGDGGGGRCQGLDDEAVRANVERLGLGALMMQAFCAQNLDEDGRALANVLPFPLGQSTFSLEFDSTRPERNWPVVHIVRSRLSRDEVYRLGNNWHDGGQSAWSHFASELGGLPYRSNSIDCVILGMTRYNPNLGKCDAHTALGGGQMALFGSGGLYSWPRTLDEVQRCWMDSTVVDKTRYFDDSAGRGTMWANFATTLGATLHEIGHCFGLDHTAHGHTLPSPSIMLRGFDNFNRWAMIEEPHCRVRPILKRDEGGAHWHPESIVKLARSPYFKPACFSSVLARLLADDPSKPRPQRSTRFEPGVRLQVIPTFRPARHISSTLVRWEKENCGEFFEKCDVPGSNEWIEVHDAEVFCRFVEAERNEEAGCVILFDASRNLLLKLDKENAYWACEEAPGTPPNWQSLGKGKWRDDHFTGWQP